VAPESPPTPKIRVGTLAIPLDTVEAIDLTPEAFESLKVQIAAVEQERYGSVEQYPADVLLAGRRPLLQFPLESLEGTMANPKAIGLAIRDRVSGRIVAYALGSALENHDEEGVGMDPHYGDHDTFYLHATATSPSVQNGVEIENYLLDLLRTRAVSAGFSFLSTLIEERVLETGPQWLRDATVIERTENYLGSGMTFAYLQAALAPDNGAAAEPSPS